MLLDHKFGSLRARAVLHHVVQLGDHEPPLVKHLMVLFEALALEQVVRSVEPVIGALPTLVEEVASVLALNALEDLAGLQLWTVVCHYKCWDSRH